MTHKRIDLHMHSLFSDGELLPSELARRALVLGHETIAITDHVDYSNIETIPNIKRQSMTSTRTGTSQLYLVPKSHMLQPNQSRHLLKRPANSVQRSLWFMGKH